MVECICMSTMPGQPGQPGSPLDPQPVTTLPIRAQNTRNIDNTCSRLCTFVHSNRTISRKAQDFAPISASGEKIRRVTIRTDYRPHRICRTRATANAGRTDPNRSEQDRARSAGKPTEQDRTSPNRPERTRHTISGETQEIATGAHSIRGQAERPNADVGSSHAFRHTPRRARSDSDS